MSWPFKSKAPIAPAKPPAKPLTNPRAFPTPSYIHEGITYWASGGMSLGDWYAGQALAALDTGSYKNPKDIAADAHDIAEAMLVERQRRIDEHNKA